MPQPKATPRDGYGITELRAVTKWIGPDGEEQPEFSTEVSVTNTGLDGPSFVAIQDVYGLCLTVPTEMGWQNEGARDPGKTAVVRKFVEDAKQAIVDASSKKR